MEIRTTSADGATVIAVAGSLNTNTARELEPVVDEALASSASVVLDLAELEYISSAGLRVVMGASKRLAAAGGELELRNLTPEVREVFDITGLSDILEIG